MFLGSAEHILVLEFGLGIYKGLKFWLLGENLGMSTPILIEFL